MTVIVGLASMGIIGLLLGLGLAFSGRWLAVEIDPRIMAVEEVLPGTNCGACGYPGCEGAAIAVVSGEAAVTVCVAGGQETADDVAAVMGVEAAEVSKVVAKIFCRGGEGRGALKYRYQGVEDCRASVLVAGGPKSCTWACVGFGNCVRVCPYDAIHMGGDGIPVVDPALCTGCGICVAECPKDVIRLVPDKARYHILCSSHDRGPVVKRACTVGCIGCTLCVKKCPNQAVRMDNFLAVMDYDKCIHAGICLTKCPTKTIVLEVRPGEEAPVPPEPEKVQASAP